MLPADMNLRFPPRRARILLKTSLSKSACCTRSSSGTECPNSSLWLRFLATKRARLNRACVTDELLAMVLSMPRGSDVMTRRQAACVRTYRRVCG